MNEGDHIIYDGVKTEIYDMFPSYKVFELPTQMPVSNRVLKWYKDINFRFVAGTNILKYSMFCEWGRLPHFKNIRQWDIRIKDVKLYGPVILVGCGWQKYQDKSDKPSMNLWKELLRFCWKNKKETNRKPPLFDRKTVGKRGFVLFIFICCFILSL